MNVQVMPEPPEHIDARIKQIKAFLERPKYASKKVVAEKEEAESKSYDSRPDTFRHIQLVQKNLHKAVQNLIARGEAHDQSKLVTPEVEVFDEFTPKLETSTYGSAEYKQFLKDMKPALDHHYANNTHHPEHYENGINGMSFLDVIELLADWHAATKRHADGNILESIEKNQERFKYSDDFKAMLLKTARELELE
jgi:hypothetical protein